MGNPGLLLLGDKTMTEDKTISFGDNVRVRETPATQEAGGVKYKSFWERITGAIFRKQE